MKTLSSNCCPSTTTTTCACNNNGGCGGCPCQNTFNPYWLPLGSPPCATTSTNNCCCNSNCNTGCNTGCFSSCNTGCNNGCSFYGRRKRHAMKRLAARAQSAVCSLACFTVIYRSVLYCLLREVFLSILLYFVFFLGHQEKLR